MAGAELSRRLVIRMAGAELARLRALTDANDTPVGIEYPVRFGVGETATASIYTLISLEIDGAALPGGAPAVNGRSVPGLLRCLPASDARSFEANLHDWLSETTVPPGKYGAAVAILFSVDEKGLSRLAARVCRDGRWRDVEQCHLENEAGAALWVGSRQPPEPGLPPERVARLTSSFGVEAYQRLRGSTVAVIGAGGTGSVAIPTLARAGVGRIVIVDSDHITPSNLERTQASFPEHVEQKTGKAVLARDHVRHIDADIDVVAYEGRLPQRRIVEAVAEADVLIGCTDQHSSRLALSDIARRYLVPAIDCGGLIEGANGRVTGQIIQLVLFRPDDPCPDCRRMIDPVRLRQELMSESERQAMRTAASDNELPPEAHEIPQIDTVGYITAISGTLAAAYAIGWLTGRFDPPFERMQMNLIADCLDVTNRPQPHDPNCGCRRVRGLADLAQSAAPFEAPGHWPPARLLD